MKCPCCGSPNVEWSGTTFKGKEYDYACNKCGYVWNKKEAEKQ